MAKGGVPFNREELALLHETLSYALRRTFSKGEQVRMRDLLGRVETKLLDAPGDAFPFSVTEPEYDAFVAAVDTYCEALEQPLSAEQSRRKAHRIRHLVARFRTRPGLLAWIRSRFGRG